MSVDRLSPTGRIGAALLSQVLTLSACGQAQVAPTRPAMQVLGEPVSLAVNGFNYTDLPIDYFSVGGAGSDVVVSSPTSGGGGTSCCVTWRPGSTLPRPMKIEWMRYVDGVQRWCEKTVELRGPVPDKPTALGVHFMPDGDIRVEITQGEADPKLKLGRFSASQRKETGNVVHDEETARCRNGR